MICRKCGGDFPLTKEYFYKRGNEGKFRSECKKCTYNQNKKNFKYKVKTVEYDKEIIRKARNKMGISRDKASELCDITFYSFSAIESGKYKTVCKDTLDKIYKGLGIKEV